MKLAIWHFDDYKEYLSALVKDPESPYGIVSKLAEAAECQPSYLSQVLHGKPHLLPDHAWGIGRYLNLSELELEYFLALVELSRAVSSKWRQRVKMRLEILRSEAKDIGSRFSRALKQLDAFRELYYSSWTWAALHQLTSLPNCQSTEALAERIGLPIATVEAQLEKLEQQGLIQRERGRWLHSGTSIEVSKKSPLLVSHLQNWRGQAVQMAQRYQVSGNVHFSGVYSLSNAAYKELKDALLKYVEKFDKVAGPSASEDVAILNCDLFKI